MDVKNADAACVYDPIPPAPEEESCSALCVLYAGYTIATPTHAMRAKLADDARSVPAYPTGLPKPAIALAPVGAPEESSKAVSAFDTMPVLWAGAQVLVLSVV